MSKISELKKSAEITLRAASEQKEGFIEDVAMMFLDLVEILEAQETKLEWFKEKTDSLEKWIEELEARISQLESRDLD